MHGITIPSSFPSISIPMQHEDRGISSDDFQNINIISSTFDEADLVELHDVIDRASYVFLKRCGNPTGQRQGQESLHNIPHGANIVQSFVAFTEELHVLFLICHLSDGSLLYLSGSSNNRLYLAVPSSSREMVFFEGNVYRHRVVKSFNQNYSIINEPGTVIGKIITSSAMVIAPCLPCCMPACNAQIRIYLYLWNDAKVFAGSMSQQVWSLPNNPAKQRTFNGTELKLTKRMVGVDFTETRGLNPETKVFVVLSCLSPFLKYYIRQNCGVVYRMSSIAFGVFSLVGIACLAYEYLL